MDKKLQDLNWSRLPKESRDKIRESYKEYSLKISDVSEPEYRIAGYLGARTELELCFGHHNVTSDVEPDEIDSGKKESFDFNSYSKRMKEISEEATRHSFEARDAINDLKIQ